MKQIYDTTSISLGDANAGGTTFIIFRAGEEFTNDSRKRFSAF